MGTSTSLAYEENQFEVSEAHLKKVSDYQDNRFGPITILKETFPPKRLFLRKSVPYNSEKDIRSIQKKIHMRQSLGGFYAKIAGNKIEKVDKLCLQELRMEITIHYSKNNLQSEIKRRVDLKKGFEIEELMHMLMALTHFCDAMDLFKSREQMLGPEIVMLYPRGTISIIETQFLRPGINRYKKMLAISYEPIKPEKWEIMAPEELQGLRERQSKPKLCNEKIHVFNIGITMLCAIGCKQAWWFYDLVNLKFLKDKGMQVLDNSGYNMEFLGVIRSCIEEDPVKRPNSADLLETLELVKTRLQIDSNLEEAMFQKNVNNISVY
jgi:hypothetical protein